MAVTQVPKWITSDGRMFDSENMANYAEQGDALYQEFIGAFTDAITAELAATASGKDKGCFETVMRTVQQGLLNKRNATVLAAFIAWREAQQTPAP